MEIWHVPDGRVCHAQVPSMVGRGALERLSPKTPLGLFIDRIAARGYNGLNVWGEPDCAPEGYANLGRYLRERGIGLFLRREWAEVLRGPDWKPNPAGGILSYAKGEGRLGVPFHGGRGPNGPSMHREFCPYSPKTREYWEVRFARDFAAIPGLAGYRSTPQEFYACYGAPWLCDCPICAAKTPRERNLAAMVLQGEILARHGGTLFVEICQDDPVGVRLDMELLRDLTGEVPDNVFVMTKDLFEDYHAPHPPHPIYERIVPDERGRSPYATSIQLQNEYRGMYRVASSEVRRWSGVFRRMKQTGQQAVWVMALVPGQEPWDHPLNTVNWYGIDRYAEDPDADPDAIMTDWAVETFGADAAPTVTQVIDKATEACIKMCYFDGGLTQCHSRMSDLLYMDSRLCGPWREMDRVPGVMGLDTPADAYRPETAAQIKADPAVRIWFGRVPITPQLKREMLKDKEDAIRLLDEAIALWRTLDGKIEEQTHRSVLDNFERRRNDAVFWRAQMDLYMDYKLGCLTESGIDELLESCRGLRGLMLEDPLVPGQVGDEPNRVSLAGFADQLRAELAEPKLERLWANLPKHPGCGYGGDPERAIHLAR